MDAMPSKPRSIVISLGLALVATAACGTSPAMEAKTLPPLVEHDELQKRLDAPDLRLIDARTRAEYDQGHIPGAVWVDLKAAEKLAGKPGGEGLKDRAAWEAWIAPLGIGETTQVLVYDGKRQLDAARVWWLLRYLGVDRVGLIDGNYRYWRGAGRPVNTESPGVSSRPFPIKFRNDRLATREDVLAALDKGVTRVVDARSTGEFTGEKAVSKRAGHIPGACNLEWSELVDENGRFLSEAALRARLKALGLEPNAAVITHCQGGGRSSVDAFVLERLGLPTRNYYLGWSDWGNSEETPVAREKKK
jgi:thiosulfate/3-mercaptopyruvate sulfurtransferase